MTLLQRFQFFKERNASPLAYYFARRAHVELMDKLQVSDDYRPVYRVPQFLAYLWIGGR